MTMPAWVREDRAVDYERLRLAWYLQGERLCGEWGVPSDYCTWLYELRFIVMDITYGFVWGLISECNHVDWDEYVSAIRQAQ